MSACAILYFTNVSPAAWQCCASMGQSKGAKIASTAGEETIGSILGSFKIAWNYDLNAKTLFVQCQDSPWSVSCTKINAGLSSAIQKCIDANPMPVVASVPPPPSSGGSPSWLNPSTWGSSGWKPTAAPVSPSFVTPTGGGPPMAPLVLGLGGAAAWWYFYGRKMVRRR